MKKKSLILLLIAIISLFSLSAFAQEGGVSWADVTDRDHNWDFSIKLEGKWALDFDNGQTADGSAGFGVDAATSWTAEWKIKFDTDNGSVGFSDGDVGDHELAGLPTNTPEKAWWQVNDMIKLMIWKDASFGGTYSSGIPNVLALGLNMDLGGMSLAVEVGAGFDAGTYWGEKDTEEVGAGFNLTLTMGTILDYIKVAFNFDDVMTTTAGTTVGLIDIGALLEVKLAVESVVESTLVVSFGAPVTDNDSLESSAAMEIKLNNSFLFLGDMGSLNFNILAAFPFDSDYAETTTIDAASNVGQWDGGEKDLWDDDSHKYYNSRGLLGIELKADIAPVDMIHIKPNILFGTTLIKPDAEPDLIMFLLINPIGLEITVPDTSTVTIGLDFNIGIPLSDATKTYDRYSDADNGTKAFPWGASTNNVGQGPGPEDMDIWGGLWIKFVFD